MNLNKKECLKAFDNIKFLGSVNIPLHSLEIIEELIEEHFDNTLLKLEELNKQLEIKDKMIDILIQTLRYTDGCYDCPCYNICYNICKNSRMDCVKRLRKWSEEEVLKNE